MPHTHQPNLKLRLINIKLKIAYKKFKKFLQECLAIAIEKERINEIKTILGLSTSSKIECEIIFNTLRTFARRKPPPFLLIYQRQVAGMKKIEWRQFHIGKFDNDGSGLGKGGSSRQHRKTCDNMLHYACRHGKTCFIDILLEDGKFNINARNKSLEKDSPLSIAADFGWIDTVKFLLKRGANINIENTKFKTPLILATELRYPYDINMCKLLINNGAQVNKVTKNQNTVILSASKFGNLELVEMLMAEGADINVQYNDGASPLMRACYFNYLDLVKYLLGKGVMIEVKNLRHETALYIAAFRGHDEIVELLISEYNAQINCEDIDGDTPLTVACYENKPTIIHYLLKHNAIVNKHGIRGDSPLHIALSNCTDSIVDDLINHGADVNALNLENETPLHIAVRQNNLGTIFSLTNRVSSLNAMSVYGNTAFRNLLENLSDSTIKLDMLVWLVKSGCDVNLSFFQTNDQMGVSYFSSSPLDYLFNFQPIDDFLRISRLIIYLIVLIVKAGYKPTGLDLYHFKGSWLRTVPGGGYVEQVIIERVNRPGRLVELAGVRVRNCLATPVWKTMDKLKIPEKLKSFLLLE